MLCCAVLHSVSHICPVCWQYFSIIHMTNINTYLHAYIHVHIFTYIFTNILTYIPTVNDSLLLCQFFVLCLLVFLYVKLTRNMNLHSLIESNSTGLFCLDFP